MGDVVGRGIKIRKETILAAGRRWEEQKPLRQECLRNIAEQGPGAADTTKRRTEFASRQAVKLASSSIVNERVIGSQDWMSFSPSERARRAADPVGRIVTFRPDRETQGFATGFLVADRLLMTNHHVFPDRDFCSEKAVNFRNYCKVMEADQHPLAKKASKSRSKPRK